MAGWAKHNNFFLVSKEKLLRMCLNMLSFWNFWNPAIFFLLKKFNRQTEMFNRQKSVTTQDTAKKKVAQNVMKHALFLEFFKIKWCVYLAYFRSYGLFKISKYIEMYWKLMFETSLENASFTFRFSWQMLQIILGYFRWVARWGGGGVPRKKKSDKIFQRWGGGGGWGSIGKFFEKVYRHLTDRHLTDTTVKI